MNELTINELVTKFTFTVDKKSQTEYEDVIKKAINTERQSFKDKKDNIDKLFKQFNDNKAKEQKLEAKLKKDKDKWLNDHNNLELKYIKEKESIRNKINALNIKDINNRNKEEIKLKNQLNNLEIKYANEKARQKQKDIDKAKNEELKADNEIAKKRAWITQQNRNDQAKINSQNRMARLDAILEERKLQRRNHQEKLDQIRQERRDRLAQIAETGAILYGAKQVLDKTVRDPLKAASDMEKANIFLRTFGDTDKEGQKFIQKKIREGAKVGAAMPLDIEEMVIELGKAGYKGKGKGEKNDLANMIPFIMKLSRATGGTPTEAGELLTNTAASFGIKSREGYSRITDMFTYALNESKLNFADLRLALKYSGGSSGAAGESLPTILANMAIARQKGINLSTLGTSSRMMTLRSSEVAENLGQNIKKRGKTQGIQETYKNLGIQESDIINKGGGLDKDKLFFYLRKKFKLDDKHIEEISLGTYKGPQLPSQLSLMKTMKSLFGVTSVSAAMALLKESEYDKTMRKNMQSEKYLGSANEVTGKLNQGFDFELKQAQIDYYYAMNNFGKEFLPIATKLAKEMQKISETLSNLGSDSLKYYKTFTNLGIALTGVGIAIRGISLAVLFLTNTNPILLGLSLVLADIINYFTGAPTLVEALGVAFRKFQETSIVGLIKGLETVINYFRKLMGFAELDFNINNRNFPSTPKELLPPSIRKGETKSIVPFLPSVPTKYILRSDGGGANYKSSRQDTVVTINQTINANNNDAPRMAKVIKDVTKENLTMINSLRPQMVTP